MIMMRDAGYDDLSAIGTILVESWRAGFRGIVGDAFLNALDAQTRTEILREQWHAGKRWPAFLALDGDRPIGVCSYGKPEEDGLPVDWGEIGMCHLIPEYWGRGIGASMLIKAQQELLKMRYNTIILWILQDNMRARRLFERSGFVWDGTEKNILIGEQELPEIRYRK